MHETIIAYSSKELSENDILNIIKNYGTDNDSLKREYTEHNNEVQWLITITVNSTEATSEAGA